MRIAKHKKTGNRYIIINENVIECTNGREDIKYVVYAKEKDNTIDWANVFCREQEEFFEKFEVI